MSISKISRYAPSPPVVGGVPSAASEEYLRSALLAGSEAMSAHGWHVFGLYPGDAVQPAESDDTVKPIGPSTGGRPAKR